MRKIASIFLVLAIIFGILSAYVWATMPLNLSGITVQPVIRGMDNKGNIQTFTTGQLTTVTYPGITKIQVGTILKFDLVGLASAKIAWWLNYQIELTSATSGKTDFYDPWEGDWVNDAGSAPWAAYWKDDWSLTVTNGQSLDLEPEKKAWLTTGNTWAYDLPDGWIPLDPATKHSFGDWVKWKWGEPPAGNYDAKLSLHVKVNYRDNFGKEKNAIGPPNIRPPMPTGANGELINILAFTINYESGRLSVNVTPKLTYSWIPLEMEGSLSPLAVDFATFFVTMGLPVWTVHIVFPSLAAAFGVATYYYHRKE